MTALFVDTSAFVALADRQDAHHAGARRLLRRLTAQRRPLVTSTGVFDELVTFVRMRLGHAVAVKVGEHLLQTRWCRLVDVDDATRLAAWQIFARYQDQLFSLTDCTSFALMRAMHLGEAFTFDRRDFAAAGFTPLP
jgi:hypothetical protein